MAYASISAATSGAGNTIVAAVAGKQIRVMGYVLDSVTAVTIQWFSNTTALSGSMSMGATSTLACPIDNGDGWFETAAGEALKMTLGGAVQVSGHLVYRLIG